MSEPYVMPAAGGSPAAEERCGYTYGCDPTIVPPNAYFMMGDDREHSQDSRNWGFVQVEKIVGRATTVYFSWDGDGHWLRRERIGPRL